MIHVPSGRIYIGQRKPRKGKTPENDPYFGSGKIWRQIYRKHKDECVKVIIDYADTKEEIDELEKKWIAYYRMTRGEFCINIADGGQSAKPIGKYPCKEETKLKISKTLTGKCKGTKKPPRTEEHKRNLSKAFKGRTPWNKGKTGCFSAESLEKMRESHLKK